MPDADRATSPEALRALLLGRGSRRSFVPVARSFLQQPRRGGGAGPLAAFVGTRRKRALDLYLLIHAIASTPPFDVTLPAGAWARALGMPPSAASAVQISKNLTWLESQRLIETSRVGGARRIVLLSDDGSGDAYTHPGFPRDGRAVGYLKLPFAYWLERWHTSLPLPATAVLLIALSLPDQFLLPQRHGGQWYGVSRDTIRRGLTTLEAMGLLSHRVKKKKAPLAPSGVTNERIYRLTGPMAKRG
jgi:hypothetical protein